MGLRQICLDQEALGFEIRVLDLPRGKGIQRGEHLFDFIVFDGAISYEVTPVSMIDDSVAPSILTTCLVLEPSKVKERSQLFQQIFGDASEWRTEN